MQGFGGGVWLDTGEGISFTIKIAFVRFAYHTANFSGLERLGDFLNAIVAVDKNWGIGYKGQLLAHIPEDMKRFRDITMGHPILYGRKTLETFPYKKPLPGRMNYILSRNRSLMVPGATVLHSISEALQSCPDNTFVIGGSEIYDLLLPYCSIAHVTKIAAVFSADAWFQNLDESAIWKLADKGALREHNGLYYQFSIYQNNHNQEDIYMLAYHRNDKLSHVAQELFQESTRGLTPVAAALPDLAIAGGYFHYTSEPLVLIPHLFLLDEAEKCVVDVLNGDDGRIISYYVASTLDEGGVDALMNSIRATGEKLEREGFRILPRLESMKLLAA